MADPHAATNTFDPAAAPPPSGPPSAAKRPLSQVPGYVLHGVLGRGGKGVVYRATQSGPGRQVAHKMVLAGGHASAAQLDRFAAEARAVAHIRHPHSVQIFGIGAHDGLPYFSRELCPGGSLDKRLNHEPQPPKQAAALVARLARAMGAAHAAGVIHRDLKPANILLDEHGEPKVTDFGLARELAAADGPTRSRSIPGTPSYLAPEQARGDTRRVGRRPTSLAEAVAAANPPDLGRPRPTVAQILLRLANAVGRQATEQVAAYARVGRAVALMRDVVADPGCGDGPFADRQLVLAAAVGAAADYSLWGQQFGRELAERAERVSLYAAAAADPAAAGRAGPRWVLALQDRGLVLAKLSRDAEAEADLRAAGERLKGLTAEARRERRPDDTLRKDYARTVRELGDFLLMRGRLDDAVPSHQLAIQIERELAHDPEVMAQRQWLALAYYRAGVLGEKKNGPGKGAAFFRSGLEIVREVSEAAPAVSDARVLHRFQVAIFTARCGDHAAAVKDLPALLAGVKDTAVRLNRRYDVATIYAVAAGAAVADPATAERYRAEAFAHLDRLVGPPVRFAHPVRLRTDPDFDPVRADPRFTGVVAKAEANAKGRAAGGP